MSYSTTNLNSAILLLGHLLGPLDYRSRSLIGHLLKDLAATPDDALDIAAKASALAATQRPIVKDINLNRVLTGQD
jgi:hypothetical protein